MGSFGLQNSCHLVWQRVIELVDEVVGDDIVGHLEGHPKTPPSSLVWSS